NLDRPIFLGKGGYGVVCRLTSLDRSRFPDVALKKFDGAFRNSKMAQRCYRELQLLSKIEHENIVKMLFAFSPSTSAESLDTVFLVTEYSGRDLETVIRNETLASHFYYLKDFKQMLIQLLNALQYLNSAKVIHRDLKPQNIAIKSTGKLTLLDFGLARVIDVEMTGNTGTRYYQAIETMNECSSRYNEKADIWSVGVILCEMITGSILFHDTKIKNPLVKAISMCGPLGENVLSQISNEANREYLEKKSKAAERIDFVAYLENHGRPWMKKEVKKDSDNLKSFIDLTLQFDQSRRMTVNEALEHPLLRENGRIPFWKRLLPTSHSIPSEVCQSSAEGGDSGFSDEEDVTFTSSEQAINHWKEVIWKHLGLISNPFV
ncbi:hypothetical protein PMAYCL1PPCAC_31757, partial [Pristionchus mayeri]